MDLQAALQQRAKVEAFQRKHRVGLLTLLFTDLVGSTKLKQDLGDHAAVSLIQRHHALVREILSQFNEGEEIDTAGDSFFIVFAKPSDAVRFSLMLQARLRVLAKETPRALLDRIGVHIGEVVIEEQAEGKLKDLYGLQVDVCARVMSLAEGDQILLTRSTFDNARQVLKGQDIEGVGSLSWLNHGPYLLKGVEEPLEMCEVGEVGEAVLKPPPDSEKVHRFVSPDAEPVLGWRPAIEQAVPGTEWVLEEKLGEGGFGEVWLGRHRKLKEQRVFKFCFRADRVRALKREVTLFRLLKDRIGEHPNIVRLLDVFFDEPPFYIVSEYVAGKDLKTWCESQGGAKKIPMETKLEIIAQAADALQAAHDAGVIHRDVKPGNILVESRATSVEDASGHAAGAGADEGGVKMDSKHSTLGSRPSTLSVKLTDFGIGQVISEEYLSGVTRAGFTMTMIGGSSPTGTQIYMAPEVVAGKLATIRSDIYSLGVVLYQCLVGDFARPLASDWAKDVHDPLLREDLESCFAGNPADRFASAGQLATNLRSIEKRRAEKAAIERATRRKRILRQTALVTAILLLFGVPILWGTKWVRESRRQLAQTYVEKGMQFADQGDYMSALPWLAEALDLDRGDREREEAHRLRLSEALRRCPKPIKLVNVEYRSLSLEHIRGGLSGDITYTDLLSFDPDSQRMVVSETSGIGTWKSGKAPEPDRKVQAWDLKSGKPLFEPLNIKNSAMVFPHAKSLRVRVEEPVLNGRNVFSVSVWDLRTGQQISRLSPPVGQVIWGKININEACTKVLSWGTNLFQVWDVETGRPLFPPIELADTLSYSFFCHKDKRIVSVTTNGIVQIWDALNGQPLSPQLNRGAKAAPFSSDISQDGRLIVLANGPIAQVWDIATGQPVSSPTTMTSFKSDTVEFSPDYRRIVTGSRSNDKSSVQVWDFATSRALTPRLTTPGWLFAVNFEAGGHQIFTVSLDKKAQMSGTRALLDARLWEWANTPPITRLLEGKIAVPEITMSRDGRRMVIVNTNRTARIWDVTTGKAVSPPFGDRVRSASFSPDGRSVVTAGGDNTARIWDANSGRSISSPLMHSNIVVSASFSPDGQRVLTGGSDDIVRLWDVESGRPLTPPPRQTGLRQAFLSADGRQIITVADQIKIWDASTGQPHIHGRGSKMIGGAKAVTGLLRESIMTGRLREIFRRFDYRNPSLQIRSDATDISFTPKGDRFVVADSRRACIRETVYGALLTQRVPEHIDSLTRALFSPDGSRIATASKDKTAQVWDAYTGMPVSPPIRHEDVVTDVAFSPDGSCILTASQDKTARIWDAYTGQPVGPVLQHSEAVRRARFTPDGRYVITLTGSTNSSTGGDVRIWEVPRLDFAAEDLVLLARLTCGSRIQKNAGPAPLDWKILKQWPRLTSKYPKYFEVSPEEVRAWHTRELEDCEKEQHWEGAVFHLERLIELQPEDRSLSKRRERAQAEVEKSRSMREANQLKR
ncbi:MAG: protein kinase [Verrucomicrobia bacterium]|nr:protein kinase [Verrucomicrobiota bacterium]